MVYPQNNHPLTTSLPSFDVQLPMGTDAKVPVWGVLQVVWRRKFLVLLMIIAIMTGAGAIIARLTPYYLATATLLIDPQHAQALPQMASPDGQQIDMVAVKTQVAIIQSRSLVRQVVDTLDLVNDTDRAAQLESGSGTLAGWEAWLRNKFFGTKEPVTEPSLTERTQALTTVLLDHVTALNDGKSYLLQISAQTRSAQLSAVIANSLAQTYLDFNRKLKIHAIEDANVRFFDQLPPLAQKVKEADSAVQRFRSDNGLTPVTTSGQSEGGTLAQNQLAQLNSQLVTSFFERVEREGRLRQITDALRGHGQLDAVPEIVNSTLIQALRQQQALIRVREAALGSSALGGNPAMASLKAESANLATTINVEIDKIARSVASSVNAAKDREGALRQQLDQLKTLVASQSEAGIKLRDLQNQADAAREVYLSYLHSFQQTASLGLMQQPDAELISRADVPMAPAGPKRAQLFVLTAVMAMITAVLCALLRDKFGGASGFVSAPALESTTGLPVIGVLPKLRRSKVNASPPEIRFFHRETINQIRATLQAGNPQYRASIVLVTSSLPREGKSHVAASLADSIIARGGRALLVHCSQKVNMSDDPAEAKTSIHSEGQPAANRLIVTKTSPDLHIGRLRSHGTGRRAPLSLWLAHDEMTAMRNHYDMIILDGPPVIACANAELLCDAVDGVVLVVRSGETTSSVILAALRILQVYGVRTIGAVLNNVDVKQLAWSGSDLAEFYKSYAADAA